MTIQEILAIIELAIGLAQNIASNTHAQADVATVAALEQLMAQVLTAYQSEVGQPMDLAKLVQEPPIA